MEPVLFLTIFVIAIAVAIVVVRNDREKQRGKLQEIAALLGAPPVTDTNAKLSGTYRDQQISYQLTMHGHGKQKRPFTEVTVKLPPVPFSLELREQTWAQARLVRKGMAVDIEVGDPVFDEAFIVEAAPADIARKLLGPDVRKRLLDLQPISVIPLDGALRVDKEGHLLELPEARRLLLAASDLGRVREAVEQANAVLEEQAPVVGDPYRAEVDPETARAGQRHREAEVAQLKQAVTERQKSERATRDLFILIMLVVVLIFGVAQVLAYTPHHH